MFDQSAIIETLDVQKAFDAEEEAARRIEFLKHYLVRSGLKHYVLGISGGIDSLAAGMLAQRAVLELRTLEYHAEFVALRLPYGRQADEADAQAALAVIGPDQLHTINIQPATDAMMETVADTGVLQNGAPQHFIAGNVKARQRMIAQYAIAGALGGLVIGTDHAAEALMGFYTKFGDGAADILPLAGLNKRRVRAIARHLGAPENLIVKVPTADLETNKPLLPDEDVYGVTYDEIDDFLEGKNIAPASKERIAEAYRKTAHKRALPVTMTSIRPSDRN
ncbi:ammonia-dependent NAD(+) synthetase [Limoniibacter endophyticus]|uniref:NH(3)-dependent NAD(+) synthetase n=1 Tax=Limoniibacter endophyticus TaxID=1565040 RepID=A0A8J3GG75_9HYPH|nr:ammonia-dependent NAD(+) synthetase [Limoniibacter endophyticus]GHC71189.1 NH(3)-dependent NAD(+) synthetase [Limoniibacter endophyticus]